MDTLTGIRPTDLPALRNETVDWLRRAGEEFYLKFVESGRQAMMPYAATKRAAAKTLAVGETARLESAELYFVSGEMTSLALAAAATLPEFTLSPEDLPTPNGLMVFDLPIVTVEHGPANHTPVIAACWSHWHSGIAQLKNGAIWVDWYGDREGMVGPAAVERGLDASYAVAARQYFPRLAHENELQVPFSQAAMLVASTRTTDYTQARGMERWIGILKTAWLLMSQPIASVAEVAFNRAARRQAEREQQPPPRVRVITLRRPAGSGGPGDSDREYHHQWIVRGHWRQQWYPSRGVHRPVWIAPHLKGPEGAPLIGGDKVYAWSR